MGSCPEWGPEWTASQWLGGQVLPWEWELLPRAYLERTLIHRAAHLEAARGPTVKELGKW